MKFVDWFAGIGGFRLGLEKANDTKTARQEQGLQQRGRKCAISQSEQLARQQFTCVGACEIDKWCRAVYAKNFGHEPEWADSRAVDPAELPDFDLFCAGFPCQSFSIAGKRRGFRDIRGTLFFEIVRICGEKRPQYLLLENVRGLLSVDNGFTFETVLATLSDIGYDCQWEVLNSKNFGVPQNRERVFIVGHLRGTPRPQVFPLGEDDEELDELERQTEEGRQRMGSGHLISALRDGDKWQTMIMQPMKWARTEKGKQVRQLNKAMGKDYTPFSNGHRELLPSSRGVVGCVTDAIAKDSLVGNSARIRRLTPLECERLQGFPDGWTEGVSDTQRYKMLGNAVTVNVIEAIGEKLLKELMPTTEEEVR